MAVSVYRQVLLKMHLSVFLAVIAGISLHCSFAQQFEIGPLRNESAIACNVKVQNGSEKLVIFQGSPHHECSLRVQLSTAHGLVLAIGE